MNDLLDIPVSQIQRECNVGFFVATHVKDFIARHAAPPVAPIEPRWVEYSKRDFGFVLGDKEIGRIVLGEDCIWRSASNGIKAHRDKENAMKDVELNARRVDIPPTVTAPESGAVTELYRIAGKWESEADTYSDSDKDVESAYRSCVNELRAALSRLAADKTASPQSHT